MMFTAGTFSFLALAASTTASPLSTRWGVGGPGSLGGLAENRGKLYFGSEVSSYYFSKQQFSDVYSTQFNQLTPENEGKWEVIHPEPNVYNWTGMDLLIQQAQKTKSYVRGHNFLWDSQTPQWVTNITDPTKLKAVMKDHIDAVMGRYSQYFYAFDVVNEPLNENGTIKNSVWSKVLGQDYIQIGLEYAHAAAPNVKLYINDYNIETVNNKSIAMAALAKNLLAKNVPLHGIGFESHFVGGSTPKDLAQSMKQFTDLGLDVAITELDIRVPVANDGTTNSTWLQIQAQEYSDVVQVCLNNKQCPGVTVWGFGDYYSWIPGVFAGEGAADLFDLKLNPKPAFYSVQKTLQAH